MTIRRPAHRPAGLLGREHFQVAYATNDIERAKAVFTARFGIREFRQLAGQMPSGGHIHVELVWVGNVMVELVTAIGEGSQAFVGKLPTSGFGLRHHHLGYIVDDAAGWETLQEDIAVAGGIVTHAGDTPGFMKSCIVEVADLGHALEYILPEPAGRAFFEGVPAS